MGRRRAASKRKILPDPKFGSELVARFINHVMKKGKKSIAEKIVYGALVAAIEKTGDKSQKASESSMSSGADAAAVNLFKKVLDNLYPTVEVRPRRVGGATYQVPVEVKPSRRQALAMRWLVEAAKERKEKTMALRLAAEMLDVAAGRGLAIKKRDEMHRTAMANQAFAHFRWWASKEKEEVQEPWTA